MFSDAEKMPFQSYGKYYDIIYADKDYQKECDFLEQIFENYATSVPKTILDAGCGTGGHAILLAKRGYEVTGIDASDVMISIAKEKAQKKGVKIDFHSMDLRRLQLGKKFDACVSMFAVIDYFTRNQDIQKVLSNIGMHLANGSLFIFDFWYGPAVLTILPSGRKKAVEKEGLRVIRFAEPRLDALHHICEVNYHIIATKGDLILDEVKEKHLVRFFFPEEIKHYLEERGFKLLKFCSFLNLDKEPNESVWNATAISRVI